MKQIKAKIKYLLSFFKSEWDFEDYPLETWENLSAEQEDIRFGASFTNWTLFVAHGDSVSNAIENLKKNLIEYRKENQLPRPGSIVPIQYTESNKIEIYEEIAIDFFNTIIGINYFDCFISDMSSLSDFELDNEETIEKIKTEYGIVPEEDLLLADIFEQISNKASA
ncbi:hypothetical protein DF185_02205 [Marinifilum breve]|uniref:Uncharacterized protein n=1 Tax=Marinifilum breve TaxID=2184082 RepID=A0A2V4A330_9BACT|nr:hypothetical protein [Marinifilum breve]PXY02928.1 hypothetical protein DF185_02205 [Marinifilum breve]